MDNVKQSKLQLNIAHWSKQIAMCQESDMTVTAWCRDNGVDKRKYYYWLRRIREETCEKLAVVSKPTIVPVIPTINRTSANDIAAKISIGSTCIEIMNNASPEAIRNILGVLSSNVR